MENSTQFRIWAIDVPSKTWAIEYTCVHVYKKKKI